MSKMGNHVLGLQETDDYQFGQESAGRGEPSPEWATDGAQQLARLAAQRLGWNDYHNQAMSL